jgi:tRNA threonylcarbamoyladenosine biosynthesis protein TsaE
MRRVERRPTVVGVESRDEAETIALGRRVVQGVAAGLGVPADHRVTSPTFTLGAVYPGRVPLFHYDAYRVTADELIDWGEEGLFDDTGVAAVEWGGCLTRRLPDPILVVRLSARSETDRIVRFYSWADRFERLLARFRAEG